MASPEDAGASLEDAVASPGDAVASPENAVASPEDAPYDPAFHINTSETIVLQRGKLSDKCNESSFSAFKQSIRSQYGRSGLLRPRFLTESFAISLRFCRAFIAHAVMCSDNSYHERALNGVVDRRQIGPQKKRHNFLYNLIFFLLYLSTVAAASDTSSEWSSPGLYSIGLTHAVGNIC